MFILVLCMMVFGCGELPGDPVSNYSKDDAGWTLDTIRRQVISARDLKRWKRMEQEDNQ